MKKLVLSLAVLFSLAMVSCGGNKAAETVDTDTVVTEEVAVEEVVDTTADTAAVEVAETVDTAVVAQ